MHHIFILFMDSIFLNVCLPPEKKLLIAKLKTSDYSTELLQYRPKVSKPLLRCLAAAKNERIISGPATKVFIIPLLHHPKRSF